jgi:hypothetical protein
VTDREQLRRLAEIWRGTRHVADSAATIALVVRAAAESQTAVSAAAMPPSPISSSPVTSSAFQRPFLRASDTARLSGPQAARPVAAAGPTSVRRGRPPRTLVGHRHATDSGRRSHVRDLKMPDAVGRVCLPYVSPAWPPIASRLEARPRSVLPSGKTRLTRPQRTRPLCFRRCPRAGRASRPRRGDPRAPQVSRMRGSQPLLDHRPRFSDRGREPESRRQERAANGPPS